MLIPFMILKTVAFLSSLVSVVSAQDYDQVDFKIRLKETPFNKVFPTGIENLNQLSSNLYATLSHEAFPKHTVRIKKSSFCDSQTNAYTGYIDVADRHLFFYFFESRGSPSTDDVLLWTNGGIFGLRPLADESDILKTNLPLGPGGSSAIGLLMELGPCKIVSPNETKNNPYSWNNNANIFFIDQPAGTGFSYSDYGEVISTTEDAASDIAAFVAIFFEVFQDFKGRAFHLTGESYAGRYIPVYAAVIYDQNILLKEKGLTPINLQSVMIGNGATNDYDQFPSYYIVQCTDAAIKAPQTISACVRMKTILPRCIKWTREACLEHLDLIDCIAAYLFCDDELTGPYASLGRNFYDMSMVCEQDSCYPQELYIEKYLNRRDVRETLGIDPAFGNYSVISKDVNQAFWITGDTLHQNQFYISELLARGIRVLIYAGTYDFICNWVGNEQWTLRMEWEGKDKFAAQPLRDWLVEGEVAGRFREHQNLVFATIYGAGHMVPMDKPKESLEMLKRWLANQPLDT